jgi:hypothetical protein
VLRSAAEAALARRRPHVRPDPGQAPELRRDRRREINAATETTIVTSNHDTGGTATNTKARGDPAGGKMSFP